MLKNVKIILKSIKEQLKSKKEIKNKKEHGCMGQDRCKEEFSYRGPVPLAQSDSNYGQGCGGPV